MTGYGERKCRVMYGRLVSCHVRCVFAFPFDSLCDFLSMFSGSRRCVRVDDTSFSFRFGEWNGSVELNRCISALIQCFGRSVLNVGCGLIGVRDVTNSMFKKTCTMYTSAVE